MSPNLQIELARIEALRPTIYFRESARQREALGNMGYVVDERRLNDPIPTIAVEQLTVVCPHCNGEGGTRADRPVATWAAMREAGKPCGICEGLGRVQRTEALDATERAE